MRRGRPPIGEQTMSGSERQRRYLDKMRARAAASKAECANCAKLQTEIDTLKNECAKLKFDITTSKRLLDGAYEQIKKIEARRERAPHPQPKAAQPPIGGDEMERKLKRKIAELRRQLRFVTEAQLGTVFVKHGDRRKILSALHPDGVENPATKQRIEIAFQIVNELFDKGRLREIEEDKRSSTTGSRT